VEFDSLPLEAAEGLMKHFASAGVALSMRSGDMTMVLDLPGDPAAYLASLDTKQRHEVQRKRRRFEARAGAPVLTRDPSALSWFAAMHRTAAGDKGSFMTLEMEAFFADLAERAGAVVDVLVDGSDARVAAAFGFEDADTYYLYNSAFDPSRAEISPGVMLVHQLIESAIDSGRSRLDFLKGDEGYKGRLGAQARALFTLEGTL
jgi:CelD/BcsL family acetyltransferase involved in cellulose biosynthesis